MKRRVKAFIRIYLLGSHHGEGSAPDIYWDAYSFENERLIRANRIVPCTITYDDGKRPAKRKGRGK